MKKSKNTNQAPETQSAAKRPISEGVLEWLSVPQRTQKAFESTEEIKRAFSLPVTLGAPQEEREKLNMAFDSIGGYDAIYSSLQQHSVEMGQYPLTSFIGYGMLQQIAQNGMIRACVQTVADDISRKWISLQGGEGTDPEIVTKLEDICESRYHLKTLFHDAVVKVGYMGGAFIFIDSGATGKDLELPLAISDQSAELEQDGFLRFVVIDPVNVTPGDYNSSDPLKPDYMRPRWWWVLGQKVHSSRLLALYDNEPPTLLKPSYNFLGIPQAQILWDYVLHWNQCRVYTADLLRKVSLLVYQTDMDAVFSSDNGIRDFDIKMAALTRYRDNNSIIACDKDQENVMNVQTSIAGCTDVVRQSLEMIAAINRTPAVKLLGISPSGFNATGESDIKNYYDHIRAKQELLKSSILTCLKCIQIVTNGRIDPGISFEFEELGTENAASVAMNASTRVGTLGQLLDRQVISPEEARLVAKADKDLGLGFIDDEPPEQEPQEFADEEGEEEQSPQPTQGEEPQQPKIVQDYEKYPETPQSYEGD